MQEAIQEEDWHQKNCLSCSIYQIIIIYSECTLTSMNPESTPPKMVHRFTIYWCFVQRKSSFPFVPNRTGTVDRIFWLKDLNTSWYTGYQITLLHFSVFCFFAFSVFWSKKFGPPIFIYSVVRIRSNVPDSNQHPLMVLLFMFCPEIV